MEYIDEAILKMTKKQLPSPEIKPSKGPVILSDADMVRLKEYLKEGATQYTVARELNEPEKTTAGAMQRIVRLLGYEGPSKVLQKHKQEILSRIESGDIKNRGW